MLVRAHKYRFISPDRRGARGRPTRSTSAWVREMKAPTRICRVARSGESEIGYVNSLNADRGGKHAPSFAAQRTSL